MLSELFLLTRKNAEHGIIITIAGSHRANHYRGDIWKANSIYYRQHVYKWGSARTCELASHDS